MSRSAAVLSAFALVIFVSRLHAQADTARGDTVGAVLRPITVTATRVPAALDKIGTAAAVVTRRDLQREPPGHAVDPLARQLGISLDEAAGPGGPTIIRLRGGEEVFGQILMDGVQVNQNGGFFDFQGLMLTNVDRIEIARGAQSALYGSTAVSGVVQFITRSGMPGAPRTTGTISGGVGAVHGGHGSGTVSLHGGSRTLRYSAGGGYGYERGVFDVPHDIRTREGSLRLDAAPRPGLEITAVGRFVGMDAGLPVRDPGATRVPLDSNARNARDRIVASLHAAGVSGRVRHRGGVALYREAFAYDDRADGVSDTAFFVFDANFSLRSRLVRTTADYLGTWESAGALPLTLAAGAQLEREGLHDITAGDFGDDTLSLDRASGALFAEARATLGRRLHALIGARTDKVEGLAPEVSPRVNALWDLGSSFALRGAVGRAWKAPNLQQQYLENPFILANADLRPETSWSYELGVRVRPVPLVELDLTAFRQDFGDLIRTVQSTSDSTRQVNQNVGSAMARGLELGVRYADPAGRRAELGATWLTTRIRDTTGLNPAEYPLNASLPFRPTLTASVLVAAPVGRLDLGVRGSFVGSQVVLSERFSGGRETLDAYALLGATLSLALPADVVAFVRGDNLLNTPYQTGYDRRGWPRVWTLGLRWGS